MVSDVTPVYLFMLTLIHEGKIKGDVKALAYLEIMPYQLPKPQFSSNIGILHSPVWKTEQCKLDLFRGVKVSSCNNRNQGVLGKSANDQPSI